ncbi:MAG: tetratricopeptide repeat protein [Candidatus Omnitrophica bacterium]|nr:tetratricopeptide repeat protein [Candidatus Omnitrophota bacterium]
MNQLTFKNIIPVLLIVVIGFIIYSNSLHGELQFDDFKYTSTPVHHFSDIKKLYDPFLARFIPLVTFALNHHFHQQDVFGYHLVNVLIHLLNAWLVYWLMTLTLSLLKLNVNRTFNFSLVTALLFLTHPIQTQAVSYITQRSTLLVAFFYLLSLCLYIYGRRNSINSSRSKLMIGLAFLSGLLAMFCKETAITLPIMIIFCELFFFGKKRLWPLIIICFLSTLIIPGFYSFKVGDVLSSPGMSTSNEGGIVTSATYAMTQPRVIVKYLQTLAIPIQLNYDYDFPLSSSLFETRTIICLIILLVLIITALKSYSRHPQITFGIGWFFITLLVESSIIPLTYVIQEHRLYLPSIGFFVVVIYIFQRLIQNEKFLIVIFSIILIACSILTIQRNTIWNSRTAMLTDITKKSPSKSEGYLNLGKAYLDVKDYRLALLNLNKAIKLKPKNYDAYNYRGILLYQEDLNAMAADDFTQALSFDPSRTTARFNRANVYRKIGRYELALTDINKVIELAPNDFQGYFNRGNIYTKMDQYDAALKDYEMVIELRPNYFEVYKSIGNVYEFQGKFDLALDEYNKVISQNVKDIETYILKANLLTRQGKNEEALAAYDQALAINPQRGDVYYKRSFLHFMRMEYDQAYDDIIMSQYLKEKVDPGYIERLKKYKENPRQ